MNTILDEITSSFPPYYGVQWTLKMKGTTPVLSLENEEWKSGWRGIVIEKYWSSKGCSNGA